MRAGDRVGLVAGGSPCARTGGDVTEVTAQYRRIAKRRGPTRAAIAVAHSILVIAFHLLRDGRAYQDLGSDYFDRVNVARQQRYHLRRLADLGCDVSSLAVSA
jgi:hypothetical protein